MMQETLILNLEESRVLKKKSKNLERGPEPHKAGSNQWTLVSLGLGQRVWPPKLKNQTRHRETLGLCDSMHSLPQAQNSPGRCWLSPHRTPMPRSGCRSPAKLPQNYLSLSCQLTICFGPSHPAWEIICSQEACLCVSAASNQGQPSLNPALQSLRQLA